MSHETAAGLHGPEAPSDLVYTAEDVARVLKLQPGTFRNKRRALEAVGFPHALPNLGARWSRAQVEAWIAGRLLDMARPIEGGQAALDRRYGGAA